MDLKIKFYWSLIYLIFFGFLIFNSFYFINGTGHDYSYFFPKMLDTLIFYQANGFTIQEYTPSYCAGVFVYANPQSMAFSLPQMLLFFFDPIESVRLTYIAISLIGFIGIFLCSRELKVSSSASFFAAILFALSGFLLTRMIVGHLAFYSVFFAPLIAWFLMRSISQYENMERVKSLTNLSLGSIFLAYSIFSGIGVMLLQSIIVICFFVILFGLKSKQLKISLVFLLFLLTISALLASPKIEASLALIEINPRGFYKLPGFEFFDALKFIFTSLIWIPDSKTVNEALLNKDWVLSWHELYYGLSPIILIPFFALISSKFRRKISSSIKRNSSILILFILFSLIPILLNYYSPSWNAIIKEMPIIGQSSNLTRFIFILIPIFAIGSGLIFEKINLKKVYKLSFTLVTILFLGFYQYFVITLHLNPSKVEYKPNDIVNAWYEINENDKRAPAIDKLGFIRKTVNKQHAPNLDKLFLIGVSNAMCYEPIFGYRFEKATTYKLLPGDIFQKVNNGLNFKNPACYVYPEVNNCPSNGQFSSQDKALLSSFAKRESVKFVYSSSREILNSLSFYLFIILAFIICIGFLKSIKEKYL